MDDNAQLTYWCSNTIESERPPTWRRFWIGVDLDGTLAEYHGWISDQSIGKPVPLMVKRVMAWIKQGETVKIFTARAHKPEQIQAVKQWLADNGLPDLEVTNIKDPWCRELWDDRAVGVEKNLGIPKCVCHADMEM